MYALSFFQISFPKKDKMRFSQKYFPEHTLSQNQNRSGFPGPPGRLGLDDKPGRVRPRRLCYVGLAIKSSGASGSNPAGLIICA